MITSGMMSSNTDQWATPQHVFDALDREFGFNLDVCADGSNHKCDRYYTREQDGLKQPWEGVCWMNPPYGRTIGKWVRKAYEASRGGGGRSMSHPSQNGHQMVEGVHHEGIRIEVRLRAHQIRGLQRRGPVPFLYRYFRHTYNAKAGPGRLLRARN